MNLYESETYLKDLDRTIDRLSIIEELKGTSVLITGVTGMIGSAVVDLLLRANECNKLGIEVIVAGRNSDRVQKRFNRYKNERDFYFVSYDASKIMESEMERSLCREGISKVNYIIHAASAAAPQDIQNDPVGTMLANFNGIYRLLSYAKKYGTRMTLFVSSSEVYGQRLSEGLESEKMASGALREDEYGYVELLDSRSSYSSAKRAGETLCACFAECGTGAVIARPGHIYGPTAKKSDNRVASAFAYAAAEGRDLVMKSDGMQLRSYCYMLDAASALLTIMLKGRSGEAYNISDPASVMFIYEMAEEMAKAGKVRLNLAAPTEKERKAFNPMQNSSLDSTRLRALGWKPVFAREEGIWHTVRIIREAEKLRIM